MSNVDQNKMFVIGRLTSDPKVEALPSGSQVVKFSIANGRLRKSNGVNNTITNFFNCVCYLPNTVKFVSQYIKKGDQVSIEAEIETFSYPDRKDTTRNIPGFKLVISELQPLQRAKRNIDDSQNTSSSLQQGSSANSNDEEIPSSHPDDPGYNPFKDEPGEGNSAQH